MSLSSVIRILRDINETLDCEACAYMQDGVIHAKILYKGKWYEVVDSCFEAAIKRLELIKNNLS